MYKQGIFSIDLCVIISFFILNQLEDTQLNGSENDSTIATNSSNSTSDTVNSSLANETSNLTETNITNNETENATNQTTKVKSLKYPYLVALNGTIISGYTVKILVGEGDA